MAVEAVDRAMRGERRPSPIYEGEDGVIAWLLDGPDAEYRVPLPEAGEAKRAILDTYTKEHSAEYQAQARIDLARRMRTAHREPSRVAEIVIHTSHHTHNVIGTGSGDPQKMDPRASRETLDHSIPYIVAVALQDGAWHHGAPTRPPAPAAPTPCGCGTRSARRRTRSGRGATTPTIPSSADPVGSLDDGTVIEDEIGVADAHPRGARPFGRAEYVEKFRTLTDGVVADAEIERFCARPPRCRTWPGDLAGLTIRADADLLELSVARKLRPVRAPLTAVPGHAGDGARPAFRTPSLRPTLRQCPGPSTRSGDGDRGQGLRRGLRVRRRP